MKVETSQPVIEYLKDVKPVDEVTKDKIVEERQKKTTPVKFRKRKIRMIRPDNLSGRNPPRAMTDREKSLYVLKPNLQYWADKGML